MSMTARYLVGDVVQRMAEIPDGSIDLVVTSPPFLSLRSYLPADHPDKHAEIGSEATPADFLDTLLGLTAEWGRVLAPHGSICVELGDTFSGSGGAGGDYSADGMRSGQPKFRQAGWHRAGNAHDGRYRSQPDCEKTNPLTTRNGGPGWPLAKSLTGIPTLYTWSLAYGRNLLTGEESPAGQWRIRNLIAWARPNPPVGALGDKFRPATSYITVATRAADRWFDLDAVRGPGSPNTHARTAKGVESRSSTGKTADGRRSGNWSTLDTVHVTNGAPPLDWHTDGHPEDGDWLWKLPTAPYKGTIRTEKWLPIDRSEVEATGVDADDIRRTTSSDCPRHGDLPGQAPNAPDDERGGDQTNHTSRTGAHLGQAQLDGFAPSGPNGERSGSTTAPMPEQSVLECDPVANLHDTGSSRTDHVPETTQPDMPSAETAHHTERIPVLPESSAPGPDTDENRTLSDGSLASPEPQMSRGTVGSQVSEQPCTCSYERRTLESTSHYATFPPALPKRLIEAMCPQHVCESCGEPRRRITDTTRTLDGQPVTDPQPLGDDRARRTQKDEHGNWRYATERVTTGWTACDCPTPTYRRGVVLDPFAGSGTTLAVATGLGRDAIGIDIDARNADLAIDRVGPMILEVVV